LSDGIYSSVKKYSYCYQLYILTICAELCYNLNLFGVIDTLRKKLYNFDYCYYSHLPSPLQFRYCDTDCMCELSVCAGSPVDDVMAALNKPGTLYELSYTSDGEITCITWTTEMQLRCLQDFSDVVMMDGTYKVYNPQDACLLQSY